LLVEKKPLFPFGKDFEVIRLVTVGAGY